MHTTSKFVEKVEPAMADMNKPPKPIKKFGKRNVFCRHYNDCLDYAVNKQWRNFACPTECAFILDKEETQFQYAVNDDWHPDPPFKTNGEGVLFYV